MPGPPGRTMSPMTEPPIASALDEATARVGDRWTLLLVQALLDGPRRFNELVEALPGIAPNVLSKRLKHLERERVLVSQPYSRRPPRFAYELTASGRQPAPPPSACPPSGAPPPPAPPTPRARVTSPAAPPWKPAGTARPAPTRSTTTTRGISASPERRPGQAGGAPRAGRRWRTAAASARSSGSVKGLGMKPVARPGASR